MENTTVQFSGSAEHFWYNVVNYLPAIIAAIIVLAVGLLLASGLGRLAKKLISYTKVDEWIDKTKINKKITDTGIKIGIAGIVGWLVKWFLVILTFIAVADILNWRQINVFLDQVVLYIPNILIAIFIMVIGLLAAEFVYEVVDKSIKASKTLTAKADILADVAKWVIIIFSIMAALNQLRIGGRLIEILFAGIIFAASLGLALAFGLGGRDSAKAWLDKWKK